MTKISFNSSLVNAGIMPNLNNAIENLNKAVNTANSVYVPSSFRYATYVNDLKDILKNKKAKIDNIKSSILNNGKAYDEIFESCNNELTMISNIKISKRDSAVG